MPSLMWVNVCEYLEEGDLTVKKHPHLSRWTELLCLLVLVPYEEREVHISLIYDQNTLQVLSSVKCLAHLLCQAYEDCSASLGESAKNFRASTELNHRRVVTSSGRYLEEPIS